MKHSIKYIIYHDGEFYCALCFDFDIFTQGYSLDEVGESFIKTTGLNKIKTGTRPGRRIKNFQKIVKCDIFIHRRGIYDKNNACDL